MNSYELRKFIEDKTPDDNGIINITEELFFEEKIIISYTQFPVLFKGKVISKSESTFDGKLNISFENGAFAKIIVHVYGILNFSNCQIDEMMYLNYNSYDSAAKYGTLHLKQCSVDALVLDKYFGDVKIENCKINTLHLSGKDYFNVKIFGDKSKNRINRFSFFGDYNYNDSKRIIDISNCVLGEKSNSTVNAFTAKGLNINLTDVEFISDVGISQEFNTFICNESVNFEKLEIHNISKAVSENNKELILKGFSVKELCFLKSYDKVILDQLNIGSLKLNGVDDLNNLQIKGCEINEFIISSNALKSLEILGSERSAKIGLLKYDNQVVPTYADGFGDILEITRLEFSNCTIPKDLNIKFYNIKVTNLSFRSLLNYGNTIFLDIKKTEDANKGLLEFYNSDLGKAIFMNCNFKDFTVRFSSSKINEIFLAGVEFPEIKDENYRTISEIDNYEQKRLCYTQLKKVYEARGDSLNSTKFHEAELSVWKKEIDISEKEKLRLIISEDEKKKLNLSKLAEQKLIYSQYKKMYEGRGDTVKAIEYQGKELDVHRTILRKTGGQYWERFQLSLNKYSNNFGQSWQWAIGWIVVVGLLFYILYCLSLGFRTGNSSAEDKLRFWTLVSYFFEFINPIRKGEFIKIDSDNYYPISGWSRVIDFFWRITITYLGYQLIQAFRKYSKKTS
jgi:hypothetical protein